MPEFILDRKFDAVVAFGGNIGPDFGPQEVKNNPDHLSIPSKVTTLAAGYLHQEKMVRKVIFPTFKTAGKCLPSEAVSMQTYCLRYFNIPDGDFLLGDNPDAVSTLGDLSSGINLATKAGISINKLAFLSYGAHVKNIQLLAKHHDLNIKNTNVLFVEDVVYQMVHGTHSKREANLFKGGYLIDLLKKGRLLRELERCILLNTVDRGGNLLHSIALQTRR